MTTRRRRRATTLEPEAVEVLRELYAEARTVRGNTPLDHPSRRASETLSELLADLWEQYDVSWATLDAAMGARPGATRARIARHGYKHISPSQAAKRYRGVVLDSPAATRWASGGPRLNLTGQKFHQLTAVHPTGGSTQAGALWLFRCDCGGSRVAPGPQVKAGKVKMCAACGRRRRRG